MSQDGSAITYIISDFALKVNCFLEFPERRKICQVLSPSPKTNSSTVASILRNEKYMGVAIK